MLVSDEAPLAARLCAWVNRAALRQRLVNFLTPEQLAKWDTEVAKAKEFLGHKRAA
jgi:hypothetical protein